MFITVLYGAQEKALFNPHCRVEALLDSVRRRCGCRPGEKMELADQSGRVQNLSQHPGIYASELLHPRETYIPLILPLKLVVPRHPGSPWTRQKSGKIKKKARGSAGADNLESLEGVKELE
ncbi:uncharacterized protein CXorf65 homolog isoform X2 [Dasypus novemcinctus]|uniref:uncharacterized protein CXorf65 homolog isoform X2 n=1 Tax=Dasypus novemcinctus TaxID=9361 RepID=UPI0039C9C315